jgi:hypothetical protein
MTLHDPETPTGSVSETASLALFEVALNKYSCTQA